MTETNIPGRTPELEKLVIEASTQLLLAMLQMGEHDLMFTAIARGLGNMPFMVLVTVLGENDDPNNIACMIDRVIQGGEL